MDQEQDNDDSDTDTEEEPESCPPPTIFLGDHHISDQFGILGKLASNNDTVGIDLDGTLTISLFGVQGSGKSYTVGSILEMATKSFKNANKLPAPLGSVVFTTAVQMPMNQSLLLLGKLTPMSVKSKNYVLSME